MIFSSLAFLVLFAPLFFTLFFLCARSSPDIRLALIAIASICFYSAGDHSSLAYVAVALTICYVFGVLIRRVTGDRSRKLLFAAGIASSVAPLAFFKYIGMTGAAWDNGIFVPAMPLAMSYVVFQQVIFLTEAYNDSNKPLPRPLDYTAGMLFFPRLVAGPLSGVNSVIDEIRHIRLPDDRAHDTAVGLGYFSIGLAKKVLIADQLRPSVDAVFTGAMTGGIPLLDAWAGLLTFFVMLYFDFSGYSDMAVGLARICGVRLPFNFNSPLKACSLIDFWARWHMSLMKFLLGFIYTPISLWRTRSAQQARRSKLRLFFEAAALPTMLTMLTSGVWHGGGWNFVIFGILHGLALTINQAWRQWRAPKIGPLFGWAATFGFVLLTLVLFRASTPADALSLFQSLCGAHEIRIPNGLGFVIPQALSQSVVIAAPGETFRYYTGGTLMAMAAAVVLISALVLPNSQQIMGEQKCAPWQTVLAWKPTIASGAAAAVLCVVSVINLSPKKVAFVYMGF